MSRPTFETEADKQRRKERKPYWREVVKEIVSKNDGLFTLWMMLFTVCATLVGLTAIIANAASC